MCYDGITKFLTRYWIKNEKIILLFSGLLLFLLLLSSISRASIGTSSTVVGGGFFFFLFFFFLIHATRNEQVNYALSEYHFIVIIFKLIKHVLYLLGIQFVIECRKYMLELVWIPH